MTNLWLKIKVWSKVAVAGLFAIYLLLFMFHNSGKYVKVWLFFFREPHTSLLYLIFFTLFIGVLATILVSMTWKTVRQIRELMRQSRAEKPQRELERMKAKAATLQTRPAVGPSDQGG